MPEALGDLDAVRARAIAANPGLRAAFERWQAALERPQQTGALPDPQLTYRNFIENVETRVGPQRQAVGLRQTLPWPGRRGARSAAAEAEAELERARFVAARAELLRRVDSIWFDAYDLERAAAVVERNRDLFSVLEEVSRRRYAAGEGPYTEVMRAQVELGRLSDRLASLVDQRRPLAARLNAALDRPAEAAFEWPTSLPERELPARGANLVAWILERSPELLQATSALERDEQRARLAALAVRPDVTLGLEWIDTGAALTPNVPGSGQDPWIASVSVNLPVWGGSTRAAGEEARAHLRAASLAREEAVRGLESSIEDGLYRLREAERRIELYTGTLLPGARQSHAAEEAAYRSGQGPFADLIDAERTLIEFELALERARSDRARAHSMLERLAGRPFPIATDAAPDDDRSIR